MGFKLTNHQLCRMINGNDRTNVINKLNKHLEYCKTELYKYESTGSETYICHFNNDEMKWMESLIVALKNPCNHKKLTPFAEKLQAESGEHIFHKFKLTTQDATTISYLIRVMAIKYTPDMERQRLEAVAINIGAITQCLICANSHYFRDRYTRKLTFERCDVYENFRKEKREECFAIIPIGRENENEQT